MTQWYVDLLTLRAAFKMVLLEKVKGILITLPLWLETLHSLCEHSWWNHLQMQFWQPSNDISITVWAEPVWSQKVPMANWRGGRGFYFARVREAEMLFAWSHWHAWCCITYAYCKGIQFPKSWIWALMEMAKSETGRIFWGKYVRDALCKKLWCDKETGEVC